MLRREICLLNTQHTNSFVLCVKIATTPIKDYEHTWLKYMKLKTLEVSLNHRKFLKLTLGKNERTTCSTYNISTSPTPCFSPYMTMSHCFHFYVSSYLEVKQTNQSKKNSSSLVDCFFVWLSDYLFVFLLFCLFLCLSVWLIQLQPIFTLQDFRYFTEQRRILLSNRWKEMVTIY